MKANSPPRLPCPHCGSPLHRTRRHLGDRLLCLVKPVLRYRCVATGCGWEGRLERPPVVGTYCGRPILEPARIGAALRKLEQSA